MKNYRIKVGKTTCPQDGVSLLLVYVEGKIMASGHRSDTVKVIDRCGSCMRPGVIIAISEDETNTLIAGVENFGKQPTELGYPQAIPSGNFLAQIEEEAKAAIKRGWDASKVGWRKQALTILLKTALSNSLFTVNDFRKQIIDSGIKTHDNRAMGGLMVTARNWGWIKPSGGEIVSKVGHKSKLQVWRSNIIQEPSARERREFVQPQLL